MKIKKLSLKNIRSYKEQEIEFPDGSLLLSGDVGSGKTTILLAIEYALFGLQPGQKGSALLRNNADLGEVSLELEVAGKPILIERKIKRGSKSVTNDYASVTYDDKKLESSITEVKTKILSILGYPPEFIKKNNILYRYTVYTPQEQMKQIILEDSETRLNILRHVFGIDKYKRIRENLSILLNRLREESKILQLEIKSLDAEKERFGLMDKSARELEERIKEKYLELEANVKIRKDTEMQFRELEQKSKERDVLETEVEKTKIIMSSKRENIFSLIKEDNEISSAIAESGERFSQNILDDALSRISAKSSKIDEINSSYILTAGRINSLMQSRNQESEKKNRVFKIALCPTCLQTVPEAHKHNIMNATESALVEINKSLELAEKEKKDLILTLDREKSELLSLQDLKNHQMLLKSKSDFLEKSIRKKEEIKKNRENLEKDLALLSEHLNSLKEVILRYSTFENAVKTKKEELRMALLNERNSEISIAESKKELELTRKEISRIDAFIKEKEISKSRLSELSSLIDWLSNQFLSLIDFTERNVLIRLRNEFSALFSKWFNVLAGDSFDVRLDENFTPLIIQGEIEMEYSFLSGGERTAVALAYRLALNQTINSVLSTIKTRDIIILDEPTEGFSEAQIDKMSDIFEDLNISQLIIVSHEQKIEGFVANVIKIKKEEGISSCSGSLNQDRTENQNL